VVVLRRCEVNYKRSSLVGTALMGMTSATILQDCSVRLGDRVKAGQVLGRIMDRDIQVELEIRTAEAQNLLDVRINETKAGLATNKLKRTQKLQNRNSLYVPAEERANQELDLNAANLEIAESRYELRLAELKRRQTEIMMHSREYVSPHDGVVVEVRKEQGEAVTVLEPVFKVVDVDWLRVTGYLNLGDFWRVREGQAVRISPEIDGEDLPVEREVFPGRIVFVDRRIDPATRTCKVVAEVANRDLMLASGLEARMEIFLGQPSTGERAAEPAEHPATGPPTGAVSQVGTGRAFTEPQGQATGKSP